MRTYLTSVIGRLLLDQRNSTWGKWRPSAAARRGGALAIQLEKLTLKGLSFEHACDMLESARGQAIDRRTLRDIFDRFPKRARRYPLNAAGTLAGERSIVTERNHGIGAGGANRRQQ